MNKRNAALLRMANPNPAAKSTSYKIVRKFYRNKRAIEKGDAYKTIVLPLEPMTLREAEIVRAKFNTPANAVDFIVSTSSSANPTRKTMPAPAKPVKRANPKPKALRYGFDARDADQGVYTVHDKRAGKWHVAAVFRDFLEAKAWAQKYADANNSQVKITGNLKT